MGGLGLPAYIPSLAVHIVRSMFAERLQAAHACCTFSPDRSLAGLLDERMAVANRANLAKCVRCVPGFLRAGHASHLPLPASHASLPVPCMQTPLGPALRHL